MSEGQSPPEFERRDQLILDTVLKIRPKLYVNPLGVPCIMLPLRKKRTQQSEYPIRHSRTQAALAYFLCKKTGLVPHQSELNRILNILEGKAWRKNKTNPELADAFDSDPLLETVFLLLKQKGGGGVFKGTCTKLANELNRLAISNAIDSKHSNWPKGIAQLSHRLWQAKPILNKACIEITRKRLPGGQRNITLTIRDPCDTATTAASQQRHAPNSPSNQCVRSSDAIDGAAGGIFDRISAPPGET